LYLWQLALVEAAGYLSQQQPRKALVKFARHVRGPWHDYGAGSAGFATPFDSGIRIRNMLPYHLYAVTERKPLAGKSRKGGVQCGVADRNAR
jgi:hypothetical protein